jgi:hypothetical protein
MNLFSIYFDLFVGSFIHLFSLKNKFVIKYYTIETSSGRQVSTTFYFNLSRIPMYLNGRHTLLCDMI